MFDVRKDLASSNVTPEQAGKFFWNWIALHETLSEDDMREFAEYFNWRKLSDHQQMSESFIRENADRVHWDRITQRIRMSEEFIEEFADKVVWDYVWSYQKGLSTAFIERHVKNPDQVNWERITMYQKLDEKFIFDHVNDLKLDNVLEYQKPPRELFEKIVEFGKLKCGDDKKELKEFECNSLWRKICRWRNLPEKEINRYLKLRGKHGWFSVLENQTLSEEFIEKHYKDIKKADDLYYLFSCQKLSEDFIKRHEEDITAKKCWHCIRDNKKIKKTKWMLSKIK